MTVTHRIGLRVTYEGFLIPSARNTKSQPIKLTLRDRLRLICGSPFVIAFTSYSKEQDTFDHDGVLSICMPERDEITRSVANELLSRGLVFKPEAVAESEAQ